MKHLPLILAIFACVVVVAVLAVKPVLMAAWLSETKIAYEDNNSINDPNNH